jgi:7-carboxy-7-deazaguanine synthase
LNASSRRAKPAGTVGAIRAHSLDRRFVVLLSSVFGRVAWLLDSRLDVRMQLQLHKFIWEPDARGV